jgi:hypothetical protein
MRKLVLSVLVGASLLGVVISTVQAQVIVVKPPIGPTVVLKGPSGCIGPVCL